MARSTEAPSPKSWMIVRKSAPEGFHVPPSGWLGTLIGCRCGHGIGYHTAHGCEGDYRGPCPCRSGASSVLGAAVTAAREEQPAL